MPDVPVPLAAAFLPRYRLDRELGVGGMATVYLAHDTKHGRDVAVKVLKRDLAAAIGADRFIAEIRTTAHLRHPHILPLFDSGTAQGLPFYVMPYVDGESLRARLRRERPLAVVEAIGILREVADALAYAHASGVVHRDIKPDNVLMSGRHVFLADFGVARAVAAHAGPDQTMTATGVMVGTLAYMAPEQVTTGPVDHRSDIYAFGVLAYELLTGATPFAGSGQDLVTAHLTQAPAPLTDVRPDIPEALSAAIMRCLEKRPDRRWPRVEDLLPAFDTTVITAIPLSAPPAAAGRGGRTYWILASLLAVVSVTALAGWYAWHGTGAPGSLAVGRILRVTTEAGLELDPAVSPDGRTIAYAAGAPGEMRIYVRQISGGRMMPVTDESVPGGQRWPQWSPDGTQLAFQTGRQQIATRSIEGTAALFVVPALGGVARRINAAVPQNVALAPAWAPDGTRLAFGAIDGLYVLAADGSGAPERLAPAVEAHSPAWSPDGRRIAFVSRGVYFTFGVEMLGNVSTSTLFLLDVESRTVTRLTSGDWLDVNPVWMPDNRMLLFISSRGGGRDVFRLRVNGSPDSAEREPERISSGLNAHGISLSRDGRLLAYSSYVQRANIWSVAIPDGRVASVREAQQVTFGSEKIEKLAVSLDGRWLAYDSDRSGQSDIWKMPLPGGTPEQVTRGSNNEFVNDWSPDGQEIVYHSMREGGQRDVMVVSADGMATEAVAASPAEEQHAAWGPDGNSILFDLSRPSDLRNQLHVATRARRGSPWGPPRRLTSDGSSDPKWSPDGRLIAYCVEGQLRVIAPDATGQRVLVSGSRDGVVPEPAYPIWSSDSRTIYYKAYGAQLQSSIWAVSALGGKPRLLVAFDDPSRPSLRREFGTDGGRFYFTIAGDDSDLWAMELVPR